MVHVQKFNCVNYMVWKNQKKQNERKNKLNAFIDRTLTDERWAKDCEEWAATTNKDDDDDEILFHLLVVNGFDVQRLNEMESFALLC